MAKLKVKQAPLKTGSQLSLNDLIIQGLTQGSGPLKDLFGGFNAQEFEKGVTQPALKNFQENILPQIQEKFIAGNQVLGSGMRRGQIKGATDLQSMLSNLMYQAQQQQRQNQISGISQALGFQPHENIVKQPDQPWWQKALNPLAQAGGAFLGSYAGNPGGGANAGAAAVNALPGAVPSGQPIAG